MSPSHPEANEAKLSLETPQLREFINYREYLKAFYAFRQKETSSQRRSYSYADFAAAAGLKSPQYLKLVIEGRRNLSRVTIQQFSKALKLSKLEAEEFRALVLFSQAESPLIRNQHLRELNSVRRNQILEKDRAREAAWNGIPGWLEWILFALTDQANASLRLDSLKKTLRMDISLSRLKQALNRLIQRGDLKDTGETIIKARSTVEAPKDLPPEIIRQLQSELIYLGIESLYRDHAKEREFGAMTVALTQKEFEQLRFELRQLRKKWQKDLFVKRSQVPGDQVYQLNIQLFPVTYRT